jgi:hypothetical protein
METERIAKLETQVEVIKEDVAELKNDIKELHSRVTTQTREIVDKMDDMQTRLEHRMIAQAEVSAAQHKAIQESLSVEVDKVSKRVTDLERWKWYVIGAAATIGYLVANIAQLTKFFQ